ncbi:hypothetical protein AgCh_039045 [Apium graveolens]
MEDGAQTSVEDGVVKQEENGNKGKILHKMEGCEMMIVRFMGVVLSLAAAVVAGVDEESSVISLATLAPCLPPLDLSVTAKWHYLSSTVLVTSPSPTLSFFLAILSSINLTLFSQFHVLFQDQTLNCTSNITLMHFQKFVEQ